MRHIKGKYASNSNTFHEGLDRSFYQQSSYRPTLKRNMTGNDSFLLSNENLYHEDICATPKSNKGHGTPMGVVNRITGTPKIEAGRASKDPKGSFVVIFW